MIDADGPTNHSIGDEVEWTDDDGCQYRELIRQEYGGNGVVFSGGEVKGAEPDTLYLKWYRPLKPATLLLLRPDEMAAIAWCAAGVLWSDLIAAVPESVEAGGS